ncbi:Hypp23 [Branchiostoma lanceolatum]|uniref:Hypp23 protein n=1 Tax=Branchiostoma lanceolatum TaxID=7740 RepID=A0A8J9W143_BRALA|nr:Hypp23 [Branchiostoma lanceolatum]
MFGMDKDIYEEACAVSTSGILTTRPAPPTVAATVLNATAETSGQSETSTDDAATGNIPGVSMRSPGQPRVCTSAMMKTVSALSLVLNCCLLGTVIFLVVAVSGLKLSTRQLDKNMGMTTAYLMSISERLQQAFLRGYGSSLHQAFLRGYGSCLHQAFLRGYGSSLHQAFLRGYGSSLPQAFLRGYGSSLHQAFLRGYGSSLPQAFLRGYGSSLHQAFLRGYGSSLHQAFLRGNGSCLHQAFLRGY